MTHSRPQFSMWSGAALVPEAQEPRSDSPVHFRPGDLTADGREWTVSIEAWNHGEPTSARVVKVRAELRSPTRAVEPMAWVNDAHPWSRRLVPPAFVDLPHDRPLVLAEIHVQRPSDWPEGAGELLLDLRITDRQAAAQTVILRLPLERPSSTAPTVPDRR